VCFDLRNRKKLEKSSPPPCDALRYLHPNSYKQYKQTNLTVGTARRELSYQRSVDALAFAGEHVDARSAQLQQFDELVPTQRRGKHQMGLVDSGAATVWAKLIHNDAQCLLAQV